MFNVLVSGSDNSGKTTLVSLLGDQVRPDPGMEHKVPVTFRTNQGDINVTFYTIEPYRVRLDTVPDAIIEIAGGDSCIIYDSFPVLKVSNKVDLKESIIYPDTMSISAKTSEGVPSMIRQLLSMLLQKNVVIDNDCFRWKNLNQERIAKLASDIEYHKRVIAQKKNELKELYGKRDDILTIDGAPGTYPSF